LGRGSRTALPRSEAHAAERRPQFKNRAEKASTGGASGGKRWGLEGPDTWVETCLNTPGTSVMERNYTSPFQVSIAFLQLYQLRVFSVYIFRFTK